MVKAELIRTRKTEIRLDEEGILWVKPMEGVEVDLEEAKRCFEIYRELGCRENKVLQLLDAREIFSMTGEAREYSAKQGKDFFIASAIISRSLGVRIVVNFFNRVYKHGVPFRMFPNEKEALTWLRKFRKK